MKVKIIIGIILLGVVFSVKAANEVDRPLNQPETKEEFQAIGERTTRLLPDAIGNAWKEAINILKKTYNGVIEWLKEIWEKVRLFFERLITILKGETERRKPIIEEEFQKEKQEMRGEVAKELPNVRKTLWQKFLELIK